MKKTIILDGQIISYSIRAPLRRARNLRMTIELDGTVVITVPHRRMELFVEPFLRQKSAWILRHINKMKKTGQRTVLSSSQKDYEASKKDVWEYITKRLEFFNSFYRYSYNRVSIRNQSSLWGSCTRAGNLQFNYKLKFVPPKTLDYVVVHELCHLKEHNHSDRFWKLVARMIPDYKIIRKSLHTYILKEG